MRIRALALALTVSAFAVPLGAQEQVPSRLSLEAALNIARANNPTYLQSRNDEGLADWDVKSAYGSLLPSINGSTGMSWQGAGEQRFGSLTLGDLGFGNQPSYLFSNYSLNLSYNLSYSTLKGPSQAKAQREVTRAQTRVSEANLVSQVTTAYVEFWRSGEVLRLAEQQLENSRFNLRLAQGQLEVGQVTPIDVGQAEIQVGRNEVSVLQAENATETSRMRLLQQLGVPIDQRFELSTTFELTPPTWEVADLTSRALDSNPSLVTTRRSRESAELQIGTARSAYYPSLSIGTSISGFAREASSTDFQVAQAEAQIAGSVAQCAATNDLYSRLANPLPPLDCTRFVFTDVQRQAIQDQNNQFPFSFERSPPSIGLTISVPIFQGLGRQRSVEAARLQRDDLLQQEREQELGLQADLAISLANVRTAYESAILEGRNRTLAETQLRLARERYQLGAITFVELVDAQTVLAQAERDRVFAVFAYHDTVTNLEALLGASLRN